MVLTLAQLLLRERDVFEGNSQSGFSFTTPYVYVGMVFAGSSDFVDCAESKNSFDGVCRDLKVCAAEDTTHFDIVYTVLPGKSGYFRFRSVRPGPMAVCAHKLLLPVYPWSWQEVSLSLSLEPQT